MTVVFSEAVTGFVQSELSVSGTSGATITAWDAKIGGTDYVATITPTRTGTAIFNVAANVAEDAAENLNTAAAQQTVQIDLTHPTVSIDVPSSPHTAAAQQTVQIDLTHPTVSIDVPSSPQNGAYDVTVVFSEAVTGFVQSELSVSGTSGATITAWDAKIGGTDYIATITPTRTGTAIFNVAANVAEDTAENLNTAAVQQTVQIDLTHPTVSIDVPSSPQNGAYDVTVVFSEAVTGFVQSELSVSGTSGATITAWDAKIGGTDYIATITPTRTGTAIFNVAANVAEDAAENLNTAAAQQTVQVDLTHPTVSIDVPSSPQNGAYDVTVVFSEAVTGFVQSELSVSGTSGATITAWDPKDGGTDYVAMITPTQTGTAMFNVAANVAQDAAENLNTAAVVQTVQVDLTVPTVVFNEPETSTPREDPPIDEPGTDTSQQQQETSQPSIAGTSVAKDRIIFNEIRNATDDRHDWVEIKNISSIDISLKTWEISIVNSQGDNADQDIDIVSFPDYILRAGEILLITNAPHSKTDLIRGQDIQDPEYRTDIPPQYLVAPGLKLPDSTYLLILRSVQNQNGNPEALEDVAGNYYRQFLDYNTDIWPLRDTQKPYENAQFLTQDKAWQRTMPIQEGYDPIAWRESGYQSGLGYKPRSPKSTSLGTPGYTTDIFVNNTDDIVFSEIMYASNRSQPQWIELYNNSKTKVVNLEGWKLVVKTLEGETYYQHSDIILKPIEIMPNQIILLVTGKSHHSENILEHRVYDLSERHNDVLELNTDSRRLIGLSGFLLKLYSADGRLVDIAGNLDGQSDNDEPFWELPRGITKNRERVSLIRRFKDGKPLPGDKLSSWKRTANIDFGVKTYWGSETDIGNPGYRIGTPLPVTLTFFRAEMTDAGVVINWTTESELENAGFNILRSQSKQGLFEKVNPILIQGAGTTGERNTYFWTDTTTKPNVIYYYRIEDVSFAGVRQQLATVRLKGHISANKKFTLTWGALKTQE